MNRGLISNGHINNNNNSNSLDHSNHNNNFPNDHSNHNNNSPFNLMHGENEDIKYGDDISNILEEGRS